MQLTFTNGLFVIIFFNMLLIVAISLVSTKGSALANRLFATFVLAKALCFTTDFFYHNSSFALDNVVSVFFAGYSFDLLLGPLMLLYFKALSSPSFKLKRKHLYHLLPFLMHVSYMSVVFFAKPVESKVDLITSGDIYTWHFSVVHLLIYVSFVVYAVLLIKALISYHKRLKAHTAAFDKYQLNWMLFMVSGLILIWAMAIGSGALNMMGYQLFIPIYFYIIPVFAFVNVLFFKGINYPAASIEMQLEKPSDEKQKSSLDDARLQELLERVLQYTKSQKPYLDPDVNITSMSEAIGLPAYQLSHVLNKALNKNFFTFISEYRIEESKRLLALPENKQTVLEILYAVGFNSKSAFNNAFKKQIGRTPTQYRKEALMAQKMAV